MLAWHQDPSTVYRLAGILIIVSVCVFLQLYTSLAPYYNYRMQVFVGTVMSLVVFFKFQIYVYIYSKHVIHPLIYSIKVYSWLYIWHCIKFLTILPPEKSVLTIAHIMILCVVFHCICCNIGCILFH